MEHNLLYFYKNSLLRDLCSEYNKEWKACKEDREKLMQLALQQRLAQLRQRQVLASVTRKIRVGQAEVFALGGVAL